MKTKEAKTDLNNEKKKERRIYTRASQWKWSIDCAHFCRVLFLGDLQPRIHFSFRPLSLLFAAFYFYLTYVVFIARIAKITIIPEMYAVFSAADALFSWKTIVLKLKRKNNTHSLRSDDWKNWKKWLFLTCSFSLCMFFSGSLSRIDLVLLFISTLFVAIIHLRNSK